MCADWASKTPFWQILPPGRPFTPQSFPIGSHKLQAEGSRDGVTIGFWHERARFRIFSPCWIKQCQPAPEVGRKKETALVAGDWGDFLSDCGAVGHCAVVASLSSAQIRQSHA